MQTQLYPTSARPLEYIAGPCSTFVVLPRNYFSFLVTLLSKDEELEYKIGYPTPSNVHLVDLRTHNTL